MRTLIISTEGQSEDAFVKKALAPYLHEKEIYVKSFIIGNGRVERGGWSKPGQLQKEINEILHSPENKRSHVMVTTMYDFADIKNNFPDYQRIIAEPNKYVAVEHAELLLQSSFPKDKFIPYFQLHQFETLVFTQPEILLQDFPGTEKAIDELIKQRNSYETNNPELINSTNKPSYRIASALGVDFGAFKGITIGSLVA